MNIHPIFVHFPIALLTVYSLMELIRFRKIIYQGNWFFAKAFIVIIGTLGSYAAFAAGDPAAHLFIQTHPGMRNILQIHELWATTTVSIFSLIALLYLVQFLKNLGYEEKIKRIPVIKKIWSIISMIANILYKPIILIVLALSGLCAVTLTGAFGGSLIYGSTSDPFISLVYKIFIK